jgi:hypothetical protein
LPFDAEVSALQPLSKDSIDVERLPFRADSRVARLLGIRTGNLEVCPQGPERLPNLRCVLARPVTEKVSLVLRVHSRAGIPLASASIDVNPGDQAFEAPALEVLAMEGYSHLGRAERAAIERRVWSRRAFATGSTT